MEECMPTVKTAANKSAPTKRLVRKTAKKVTFGDVRAIIKDIGKELKEVSMAHKKTEKTLDKTIEDIGIIQKETEKTLNKAIEETEKTLNKAIGDIAFSQKETEKTLNKAIKETEKTLNKAIGGLSNTLGSLVEHIMTPGLPSKFREFGFTFDRITTVKWAGGNGNIYAEIDGLLENGIQAMVVEVKTTLRRDDVDDHLGRMERVRKYADDHGDKREFLGAMAATITDKDTKAYALSKGFFVIEPSGEDVKITNPVPEPKIW
jgi:hypothetical protein